jgi:ABC-type Na+ efflux pump permease subunit
MNKIWLIAQRDFLITLSNRGFLFGLFIMPLLIGVAVLVGPRLISANRSPQVVGRVVVMDPTGQVLPALRSTLSTSAIEARRAENARRTLADVPAANRGMAEQAMQGALGTVPNLTIEERPADAASLANTSLENRVAIEKQALSSADSAGRPLALVVIRPDSVGRTDASGEFGTYDLYASRTLDDATETVMYESLREALVNARLGAAKLDQKQIDVMTRVKRPNSTIVTAAGEQRAQRKFMQFLPFLVGVFIFVGVITGGQTLMTSTVEEKSSRVVEVLLAAVSPFQLMAGKLLGQAAVGLLAMAIYLGLGLLALYSFAMFGIIDPMLIVYFLVFFLITYLIFGALMMSIGAAVNQIQEAQSLMGPVMLLLLVPYMMSPMIGRAPNSTLSVAISFIPPMNTMAMMTRMASDSPPPAWQVWLTVLVGLGGVYVALWFAAKIFKVGLLMHGRPPNIATLIRWARQA